MQLDVWMAVIPGRRQVAGQIHSQRDRFQQLALRFYLSPENHSSAQQSATFGFLNEFLFTSGASFWCQCKHKQTTGSM